uniref:Uncharacterized protein n=1 Tax=Anopheles maculatus TaxID=74869 RepID=A0A182SI00_9DIPT
MRWKFDATDGARRPHRSCLTLDRKHTTSAAGGTGVDCAGGYINESGYATTWASNFGIRLATPTTSMMTDLDGPTTISLSSFPSHTLDVRSTKWAEKSYAIWVATGEIPAIRRRPR